MSNLFNKPKGYYKRKLCNFLSKAGEYITTTFYVILAIIGSLVAIALTLLIFGGILGVFFGAIAGFVWVIAHILIWTIQNIASIF